MKKLFFSLGIFLILAFSLAHIEKSQIYGDLFQKNDVLSESSENFYSPQDYYMNDVSKICNSGSDPEIENFSVSLEEGTRTVGLLTTISDADDETLDWEIDFGDDESDSGTEDVGNEISTTLTVDQTWGCDGCRDKTYDACDFDSFLDGADECYDISGRSGSTCLSDESMEVIRLDIVQSVDVGSCDTDPPTPGTDKFEYTIMCNTSSQVSLDHTYQSDGTYTIKLTVKDEAGHETSESHQVIIENGGDDDDDNGDDDDDDDNNGNNSLTVAPKTQTIAVGASVTPITVSGSTSGHTFTLNAGTTGITKPSTCSTGATSCALTAPTAAGTATLTVAKTGQTSAVATITVKTGENGKECHLWNAGDEGEIPSEFAYPWDLLSDKKETTVVVRCYEDGIETDIGNDASNHIIWKKAWISKDGVDWTENVSLSGSSSINNEGEWFLGSANFVDSFSEEELQKIQYISTYQCDYVDDEWQGSGGGTCGCEDDECTDVGHWTLQAFQKDSGGSGNPTVTLRADPSTLNSPGKVTLFWETKNIGADWKCTASEGWSGDKDPKGSTTGEETNTLSATTTFKLRCVSPDGSKENTGAVTVTVSG